MISHCTVPYIHRERSLTLLDEKDGEIHKLREQIETSVEESFFKLSEVRVRKSIN